MSRIIRRYVDGKAVWEDLGPSEAWLDARPGRMIGGSAIEAAAPPKRGEPSSPRALHAKLDRDAAK